MKCTCTSSHPISLREDFESGPQAKESTGGICFFSYTLVNNDVREKSIRFLGRLVYKNQDSKMMERKRKTLSVLFILTSTF